MDPLKFGEYKTGTLVPITALTGESDYAFVPSPLPPAWSVQTETALLYARALAALRELNGACKNIPNPQLLIRPLQQREAIRSSRIENTYTSLEGFLFAELEAGGRGQGKVDPQSREVHNYYAALREGFGRLTGQSGNGKIDIELVLTLHERLLRGVRGHDLRGKLRPNQAYIRGESEFRRFNPPPVNEMQGCLPPFWSYLSSGNDYPPLIRAFLAHYQFETIHPFADGNGRIGRVLLALSVFVWEKLDLPWLYMSEHFDKTRGEYINRLFRVSTNGEWAEWIDYCLTGVIEQSQQSLERVLLLIDIQRDYRELCSKKKRLPAIIDMLLGSVAITVSDLQEAFSISDETARADIRYLRELGVLEELPTSRPKCYYCPKIVNVAYSD